MPTSSHERFPAALRISRLRKYGSEPLIPCSITPEVAEVTKLAPFFRGLAVVDGKFKEIQLSDYVGKYLVLFFYPSDFTFVCPTEITLFSDRASEFKELNAEVVGASTDTHFAHLTWINMSRKQGGLGKMKIPLMADAKKEIARAYGVLNEPTGLALRGLFIICPEGVIRHMTINDFPVGRCVDEVLRTIKAFQHVAEHGEVCPANWQPNSKSIKPNVEEAGQYFETLE